MIVQRTVSGIRMTSVRRHLGRLYQDWRRRSTLLQAARLVPAVLADLSSLPGAPQRRTWVVRWSHWSDAGGAVMGLGPRSGPTVVVVKVARMRASIREIAAERKTLAALQADGRLGDWRSILPRTLAEGEVEGWRYFVQEALPGIVAQSAATRPQVRSRLQSIAADSIRRLHEATAELTLVDHDMLEQAVDRPIELLRGTVQSRLSIDQEEALGRLASELRGVLAGRRLSTSWIHGDFWLGNVLVGPDCSGVTAIVDWSMASCREFPLHDVLHLILHSRQHAERCELGDLVGALLGGAELASHERVLLESEDLGLEKDEERRAMVLLYWLRHVRFVIEQEAGEAGNAHWVERNIGGVLRWV